MRLQALFAAEDREVPYALTDPSVAPPFMVELLHLLNDPVITPAASMNADGVYAFNFEHKFKHKKGSDIIDRLINSKLDIKISNPQTKLALASGAVDLLAFGLGTNAETETIQLVPISTEDNVKVHTHMVHTHILQHVFICVNSTCRRVY